MKKILLLGGSPQQVIAIETAKKLGYYTVLCDFLTDNPGQYAADKFYLVSTTDKEAVLKVAMEENIDGILAYASDPAAPTAAYVAEKLGLPGNPYKSVEILCNKDMFRDFLAKHDFCTPKAGGYVSVDDAVEDCKKGTYSYPIISKPVDSSGSKGVVRIDGENELNEKLKYSMSFSHSGRIVIEEFVEKFGYQIAGDGLSIDGKLVFRCFANDHFNPSASNPFVPISASFPYNMPEWVQDKVHDEIQRLLTLLNMKSCTYNFDLRIDDKYNVYLMEVAPRDGGNYIPQIIKYATGIDLIEYSVRIAMGEELAIPEMKKAEGFWSYYAVHSLFDGKLKKININPDVLNGNIVENHILKNPGDDISAFVGANTTLGCLIMKFDSMEQMLDMMDNSEKWIEVKLERKNFLKMHDKNLIMDIISNIPDMRARLEKKVDLEKYVTKLASYAENYILEKDGQSVSFASMYANDTQNKVAYITLIVCTPENRGKGFGGEMFEFCCQTAKSSDMKHLRLEVSLDNIGAINFYKKHNMCIIGQTEHSYYMQKEI